MEWQKLKEPLNLGSIKEPMNEAFESFEVRDARDALHHPQHKWFRGI